MENELKIRSVVEVEGRGKVIVCGFKKERPYVWKEEWSRSYLLTKKETASIVLINEISDKTEEFLSSIRNESVKK